MPMDEYMAQGQQSEKEQSLENEIDKVVKYLGKYRLTNNSFATFTNNYTIDLGFL